MSLHFDGCGCKLESELGTKSKCLYDNINISCITAYNELIPGSSKSIFKKYNQRLDNGSVKCIHDDDLNDFKLLINIPLLSPTSISHIIVISSSNLNLDIYKSNNHLSIEDLQDIEPIQSISLNQDYHGSILNPLKAAKFINLSLITLVFTHNKSQEFEITYIGLRGLYQMNQLKVVETVYESRPNIADHKIDQHLKLNIQMQ